MHLLSVVLLDVFGAAVLFFLGSILGKRAVARFGRGGLLLAGLLLAAPGLLFVLYYTHLFDRAAWFYCFRVLAFTEFLPSGIGFLAGVLHSWFEPDTFGQKGQPLERLLLAQNPAL
jgi:hypothetical protein